MIPLFKVFMHDDAVNNAKAALESGYIAQGPQVDQFEKELGAWLELYNPHIVTLNSCTSAIELALHLIKTEYNLPDGTEVLSTPVTCFASNAPIIHNRMDIKWYDIDPKTLNADFDDIASKLTSNTRILMVVHFGGRPVDYDGIDAIKQLYKSKFKQELYIVEDCAHAFGSKWNDDYVGCVDDSHFSCFSFQAIKSLTTGDGGMLITPGNFCRKARLLRWFGLDRDNKVDFRHCQDIQECGFKLHMNDIAAAIGRGNLPHILNNLCYQQSLAWNYDANLKNNKVYVNKDNKSRYSNWLYTILVDDKDEFIHYMERNDIASNPVHSRNDEFSVFRAYKIDLPNVDATEHRRVAIPCGWWVSIDEQKHIVETINRY